MAYPRDYRFTDQHEWIHPEGKNATIGITEYAQEQLGDIVFVELPKVGASVKAGEAFGTVESVKAVSEIFSPVNGTVTAVNGELAKSPELLNTDPHGRAWLIKVQIGSADQLASLMSAEQYEQFVSQEKA